MAEYKAGKRQVAPGHPGLIVARALKDAGVSVREAAVAIGVSHGALNNVAAGKSDISADMAVRLGAYLKNGPELWINLQRDYDLWHAQAALKARVAKIVPVSADV